MGLHIECIVVMTTSSITAVVTCAIVGVTAKHLIANASVLYISKVGICTVVNEGIPAGKAKIGLRYLEAKKIN